MKQTCFEMLREIGFEIGLVNDMTITSFTDTALRAQLLMYLNRAKEWVVENVDLHSLRISVPFETVDSYSTGTVSVTASDTTVTGLGTTFTAAMVGRKIQIGTDLVCYEILKYTSGVSIEIDRPYAGTAQSAVAFVIFQNDYALSPRLSSIIDITSPRQNWTVKKKPIGWINSRYPNPLQGSGEPQVFSDMGVKVTQELTLTAGASTSTTSLVCTTLANKNIQNYYKDWQVYNTTRSANSRVSSYEVSTTALALETAISAQVVTDIFNISKREMVIRLAPTPLDQLQFMANGTKDATMFVNDYDYETEIDADFEVILKKRAMAEYYLPRDKDRAAIYVAQADEIKDNLVAFNETSGVTNYAFTGGVSQPVSSVWGDTYTRNEPY